MAKKQSPRTRKTSAAPDATSNTTIESVCIEFFRTVIQKDRRRHGVSEAGVYTSDEISNAAASLCSVLLAVAPFGERWQLLGQMAKLARGVE